MLSARASRTRGSNVTTSGFAWPATARSSHPNNLSPLPSGGLLGFAGSRSEIAAACAPTLAEFFALLGRHLLPTLVHALAHTPADIGARAAATPASEQNPAESQQTESLPESN